MTDIATRLGLPEEPSILAIGAHPDDIEIGAAGLIARLLAERPASEAQFVVLSGAEDRAAEAAASAERIGEKVGHPIRLDVLHGRDGHLPYADPSRLKDELAAAVPRVPDLVLTHRRDDRHQDHRFASDLAWQVFRGATILEYEIAKWDGDLGPVNLYVPLSAELAEWKVEHVARAFPSQRGKDWFTPDTFRAILRLRGIECRAPSGLAEGYVARKLVV